MWHNHCLRLERAALSLDAPASLRRDIIFLDAPAVRIVLEFYARDRYNPASKAGRKALNALLWTLPDNKIVEDIHQPLRLNARANSSRRLSFPNMQHTIMESGVLEKRGIPNPCKVNRVVWGQKLSRNKHRGHMHKLAAPWSRMMKPYKTWHTLSEETLQRASAALMWLHT